MRNLIFLFLSISPAFLFSQQIERVNVEGVITAPVGEDTEGISVYNVSSQKGTITNKEGNFSLEVGINDRVLFTALQFQEFTVIVDEGIIESQQMRIYINPAVVQLDEVIVRPHDLSGNINVDVARIKTVDLDTDVSLSYEVMEFEFEFSDDRSTAVENSALNEVPSAGLNIVGLVNLLGESLFKNRNQSTQKLTSLEKAQLEDASYTAIHQRFAHSYFTETLNLSENQIEGFLYFISENGFTLDLLKENNELKLMDFLDKKSKIYLAQDE